MKTWKLCRPNKDTNTWAMSATKILDGMIGIEPKQYAKLPVQKYREADKFSANADEVFYFVEVKDTYES